MAVWGAIIGWWRARQRRLDVAVLWPQCLAGANTIEHAMLAFTVHCFNDPCWLALGEDELRFQINMLGVQATQKQEEIAR